MTAAWVAALIVIGIVVLIAIGSLVACVLLEERRAREARIARQQIVTTAEQELRDSTRDTLQAMRDVLRNHLQG